MAGNKTSDVTWDTGTWQKMEHEKWDKEGCIYYAVVTYTNSIFYHGQGGGQNIFCTVEGGKHWLHLSGGKVSH